MKHRRRTICAWTIITCASVLLLLGAIVNVAVAWGCVVMRGDVRHATKYFHNPSNADPLAIAMFEAFGYRIVQGVDRSGTLIYRDPDSVRRYQGRVWWNREALQSLDNNFAIACGWPSLSLTSWRTMRGQDEMYFPGVIHRGVLLESVTSASAKQRDAETVSPILALQPIWPGFAINTLFFAAILWLLFAAPFSLRRRRRIKRGLCPACAYPIGAADVCTECGQALPARRRCPLEG